MSEDGDISAQELTKCAGLRPCLKESSFYKTLRQVWHSIISLHGSPHDIALGTAIGLIVAFSPTMGIQMVLAAVVATIFRASRAAAIVPVWITNPVTAVPVYGFCYWLGAFFWEGPPVAEVLQTLRKVTSGFTEYRFYHIVEVFKEFLMLGVEIVIPMAIGGLIVGLLSALLAYPVVLRAVIRYREIRKHIKEAHAGR